MNNHLRLAAALFITLAFSFSGAARVSAATAKIPVILDTDIGDDFDDTWALALMLKSPQFDVKLITTTSGKAEYRGKLIAKLLTVAGRTDIPVGLGEGGHDGTGGQQAWVKDYKLADYPGKVYKDGAGALIDAIERSPEPVTVIAIGPLHTLAAALERRPGIAAKAIFAGMMGSVRKGYGGRAPSAEYNVACNAPAARHVLSAPWKKIIITPLDTCDMITISGKRFAALKQSQDPLVKALLENYRIWARKDRLDQLDASSTLFDTVAVYLAYADSTLLKQDTMPIRVTNEGFTQVDSKGRKMAVATAWKDLDSFRDRLVEVLMRP